jgi:hypothetical protein
MVTKGMTRAELIRAIKRKVSKTKPIVRDDFIKGLKYKNKATLVRYLNKAKVDKDGYGISLV